MVKRNLFFVLLMACLSSLCAQNYYLVWGEVVNATTKKPIEYVNIKVPNSGVGTITDKKGKYTLLSSHPIDSLVFSCMGYHLKGTAVAEKKMKLNIDLQERSILLSDVTIKPKENPAFEILRKVHYNSIVNDQNNYPSHHSTYYSKSYFSSDIIHDSIAAAVLFDTLHHKADTLGLEMYNFLEKQHLFMMESVIERYYKRPGREHENVIASKISGFSDPIFHLITRQLNSFTVYKSQFSILGAMFENPLMDKNFKNYQFSLESVEVQENNDTIYTISFKPLPDRDFRCIAGFFQINSDGWAIQKALFSPIYDGSFISIVIEQNYAKVDGVYWFPSTVYAKMDFNVDDANLMSYPINGYFHSTYSDIEINIPIKNSLFVVGDIFTSVKTKKATSPDLVLEKFRLDTLSDRELSTYLLWDTVSENLKLDKKLSVMKSLISGKIPIWYFDFDISRFLAFNNYEKCRIGLGFHTSDRVLDWLTVGGFWAYGFADKTHKAGFDAKIKLIKRTQTTLFGSLTYDLKHAASSIEQTFTKNYAFSLTGLNQIPSFYFDHVMVGEVGASSLLAKYLTCFLSFSFERHTPKFEYQYLPKQKEQQSNFFKYKMAYLSLYFKFDFSKKIYVADLFTVSQKNNYPQIEVVYRRGIKGLFGSDFAYNEIAVKVAQTVAIPYLGDFSYALRFATVDKDLPMSSLYGVHGTYMSFGFFDRDVFATMKVNEFLSDKFISLNLSQVFPRLYHRKWSSMQPELLCNIAFGTLGNPQNHTGVNFKTMEKGYYEVGVMLHKVLRIGFFGLGAGVYWRLGPNAHARQADNVSGRLSLTLGR